MLSEAGAISQIPLQQITLMSGGRANTIDCDNYGFIDFVHTSQTPAELAGSLNYDPDIRLWRANVTQALRDLRRTRRSLDLLQKEVLDDLV